MRLEEEVVTRCTGGLFCAAQRREALLHFAAQFGSANQQGWAASVRQDVLDDYGGLAGLGASETANESQELLGRLRKASQKLELLRLSRSTDPADLEKFRELLKHSKVKFVDAPLMEISASFIRDGIKNKKDVRRTKTFYYDKLF